MLAKPPRTKVTAKLGNSHSELLTGDYLKRRLLTKDFRSHHETGRKNGVAEGASPTPTGSRLRSWRAISAVGGSP